jgi:hypothetical protein
VTTTLFSDIKNPITKYTVIITGPGINVFYDVGPLEIPPSPYPDTTRVEASGVKALGIQTETMPLFIGLFSRPVPQVEAR